ADLILHKPGKLSPEEWEIMKTHCEIGYSLAKAIPELNPIAEYILYHHERWDGKGYPKGLKGEEIPLLARIVTIVDAYSAMLCDRPYRKAMSKQEALEEIKKGAGGQFDPRLVELFLKIVGENS
ncbi:MAG TPA: HD domain-containing protein, partial [Candidatus Desulfofervidus auxilii]|nr:HD domain-containing protein [Candidatus Desulfofervidus auxilii]